MPNFRYFLLVVFLQALNHFPAYAQTAPVNPRITEAIDDTRLVLRRGNVHPLARPEFDRGSAPRSLPMERMQLVLTRSAQQQSALQALLDAQQDKSSPGYHHWLTPEQFGEQFGPADQDVQAITSWLQSRGFQVNRVAKGRTVIEFSGTAGQVQDAFHTEIRKFVVNGEEHWANAGDPRLPAAMAPVVSGIATLHNFRSKSMIEASGTLARIKQSRFHPQYNEKDGTHALSPADYAVIYNINPLYKAGIKGAGVTIGVIGRALLDFADVVEFRDAFHLPNLSPDLQVNGSYPDYWMYGSDENDIVESTLDLSWAGAIAPRASVRFITSASTDTTDGIDLSEEYAVDTNFVDIISESYGLCEAVVTETHAQLINAIREQAAAQGITYLVSSGDSGPYTCSGEPGYKGIGPVSVNAFAASPYVVAVGGTELSGDTATAGKYWASKNASTSASALSYIPEAVWNDSCDTAKCGKGKEVVAAAGGGASKFFRKPAWQSGVSGIPADSARDVPDVSLTASFETVPYLVCYAFSCSVHPITSESFFPIGGTSASAPSMAGIMALVVQKTKSRQGQANHVLYRLAASQSYEKCNGSNADTPPDSTCIFYDVTSGNTAIPGEPKYGTDDALYSASAGYDLATGLGSVNAANLVNRWESVGFNPTNTTLAIAPAELTHGMPVNLQMAVASQSGTGTPTGDVSLITDAKVTLGPFTLTNGVINATAAGLPGGYLRVVAHYAGDGTFAPSDSAPVSVSVAKEPSITTAGALVALIPNAFYSGGTYGSASVGLSARVAGRSGQGSPTGSATFTDNGVPVDRGGGILNSEGQSMSQDTNIVFPPGRHSLVGAYSGDASFLGSFSAPAVVIITKAPSAVYLQPTLASVQPGKLVSVAAIVKTEAAPFGDPPTGTVAFFLNGQPFGSPVPVKLDFEADTLQLRSAATITTSKLAEGANKFTATYSGDANYLPSNAHTALVTVEKRTPPCTVYRFTADPNPITLFDTPGTTTLDVQSSCPQLEVRMDSAKGKVVAVGQRTFTAPVTGITKPTTLYLQVSGDSTSNGTLEKLAVGVQSGTLPCVVYSFAATPNPIISPTLAGATSITALASCAFDIRVGSPGGTLFTSGKYAVVHRTGAWVTDGMEFFLQQKGDTTARGTLAKLTVSVLASAP